MSCLHFPTAIKAKCANFTAVEDTRSAVNIEHRGSENGGGSIARANKEQNPFCGCGRAVQMDSWAAQLSLIIAPDWRLALHFITPVAMLFHSAVVGVCVDVARPPLALLILDVGFESQSQH
jgi:hypothetical protein